MRKRPRSTSTCSSNRGLDGETIFAIGVGFCLPDDYVNAAAAFGKAADLNRTDRDAVEMWAHSLNLDSAYSAIPAVAERWVELDPYNQNNLDNAGSSSQPSRRRGSHPGSYERGFST